MSDGTTIRAASTYRGYELRALLTVLAVLFLLALAAPTGAFAGAGVTSQDRAATRALLEARYTYEQALLASAPVSRAATEGLASSLGGECAGVLAGAPHETLLESLPHSESPPQSPRQMGESNRERRQLSDLQGELGLALELPPIEADRQAALNYARAVSSLRWSNDTVTTLERTGAAALEWQLQSAPPDVCADMRAWVASGYRTLSPATKVLIREREAVERPLLRLLREHLASLPGADPLSPYEGSQEKALARKVDVLEGDLKSARKGLARIETGLERTLGLATPAGAQAESEEAEEGPTKGAVEIGHGATAVGSKYTIWLEPKPGSSPRAPGCRLSMEVFETEAENSPETREIDGTRVNEVCLSRSRPRALRAQCRDRGLLTIEAQTLPGARRVRLNLSDGRQIASRVAIVPAKLGGPAGFYYQVVRGPAPIPVSLTEVDAHGKALRTVKLPRTSECVKQSLKRLKQSLKRLHSTIRTIASGSLPQGPSFSINGERSSRFSIGGERSSAIGATHFELSAEVAAEEEGGDLIGGAGGIALIGSSVGGPPTPKSSPFVLQMSTGCLPHEYAILFGLLRAPADTVLARSPGSLQPFHRVRIPAGLHAHGVLAYIPLAAVPSEVLVHTPTGKTVLTENLAHRAREAKETCEGEAEAPS
jgi:hypothetical protein